MLSLGQTKKETEISGWPLVGNEGINLYIGYIGILGMKLPSFPTKGLLDFQEKLTSKVVRIEYFLDFQIRLG